MNESFDLFESDIGETKEVRFEQELPKEFVFDRDRLDSIEFKGEEIRIVMKDLEED